MVVREGDHIAVWFSCGAASAVAAKMTLEKYGSIANVRVLNCFVAEEDSDNRRFLLDVKRWLGVPVEVLTSAEFPDGSAVAVWNKRKYMSNARGVAPCTYTLKKQVRYAYQSANRVDFHVLGFTADEVNRYKNFVLSECSNTLPVLIEAEITKQDCYRIVSDAGISLPNSYIQGYPNANCKGCVKATSPTYWNHVRQVDPEVFEQRAEQSRRIGCRLTRVKGKRIFLDELKLTDVGRPLKNMDFECGIFCTPEQVFK